MSCPNFSRIVVSYTMSVSVSMLLRIKHNHIHINYRKNTYLAMQLKIIMYIFIFYITSIKLKATSLFTVQHETAPLLIIGSNKYLLQDSKLAFLY